MESWPLAKGRYRDQAGTHLQQYIQWVQRRVVYNYQKHARFILVKYSLILYEGLFLMMSRNS